MKKRVFILTAILALLAVPAAAALKDDVVRKVEEKYSSITTLSASFIQRTSGGFNAPTTATGRAYFKKPGKMRWIYTTPVRDEIISNGIYVWVFQPDLNQAVRTVVDIRASSITKDFLSGIGGIERDFVVTDVRDMGSEYRLSLFPKFPRSDLKALVLYVRKSDYLVRKFEIRGGMGERTEVTFSGIETNKSINDLFFQFVPPPGVKVIIK